MYGTTSSRTALARETFDNQSLVAGFFRIEYFAFFFVMGFVCEMVTISFKINCAELLPPRACLHPQQLGRGNNFCSNTAKGSKYWYFHLVMSNRGMWPSRYDVGALEQAWNKSVSGWQSTVEHTSRISSIWTLAIYLFL